MVLVFNELHMAKFLKYQAREQLQLLDQWKNILVIDHIEDIFQATTTWDSKKCYLEHDLLSKQATQH